MVLRACAFHDQANAEGGFHRSLADQILWLISLRWIAVSVVVAGALVGTYLFPVLSDPRPLYGAAAFLLACNVIYTIAARRTCRGRQRNCVALAMSRWRSICWS